MVKGRTSLYCRLGLRDESRGARRKPEMTGAWSAFPQPGGREEYLDCNAGTSAPFWRIESGCGSAGGQGRKSSLSAQNADAGTRWS